MRDRPGWLLHFRAAKISPSKFQGGSIDMLLRNKRKPRTCTALCLDKTQTTSCRPSLIATFFDVYRSIHSEVSQMTVRRSACTVCQGQILPKVPPKIPVISFCRSHAHAFCDFLCSYVSSKCPFERIHSRYRPVLCRSWDGDRSNALCLFPVDALRPHGA